MTTITSPRTTVSTEIETPVTTSPTPQSPPTKPSELLREAIRRGYRQTFYEMCNVDERGQIHSVCALGAMAVVQRVDFRDRFRVRDFERQLSGNTPQVFSSPMEPWPTLLGVAIVTLNDTWKWSFERIADWLEHEGY